MIKSRVRKAARPAAAVLAGAVASIGLAASFNPSLAALAASITNTQNTQATGVLVMRETGPDGTTTCDSTSGRTDTNAASCSSINKYNGYAYDYPGKTNTTSISITNVGTVDATSFSLTGGACTQSVANTTYSGSATDLCSKMNVKIVSGAKTIYDGTAAGLATKQIDLVASVGTVTPNKSVPFTFTVGLDASADNTYAGLGVSQPLTWTFGA